MFFKESLYKILNNEDELINNKMRNILTDNEKKYFLYIYKNYNIIIKNLEMMVENILEDGKVDYHDIPTIIIYLIKLFKEVDSSVLNDNINIYNIFKFIVELTMINQIGFDVINYNEIEIINNVINSSIELLEENSFNNKNIFYRFCRCKKRKRKFN